jgi:hypothetical protein
VAIYAISPNIRRRMSTDFTVVLIDDPLTLNVRLRFVELDCRRLAPNFFCLLLANQLYVINYVPLTLYLISCTEKWEGQTAIWPPTVPSGGEGMQCSPCDGAPASSFCRFLVYVVATASCRCQQLDKTGCLSSQVNACKLLIASKKPRPVSMSDAIVIVIPPTNGFPDLRQLVLRLALTAPVANVAAERSFSCMLM